MSRSGPYPGEYKMSKSLDERFWEKVARRGHDECWEWIAAKNRTGYGAFGVGTNKVLLAHRAAWIITYGALLNKDVVRHYCDNPGCVNPDHLETGTHEDNARDKMAHGNILNGERNHQSKLTKDEVMDIYKAKGSRRAVSLASQYGLSRRYVYSIWNGDRWSWLTQRCRHQ